MVGPAARPECRPPQQRPDAARRHRVAARRPVPAVHAVEVGILEVHRGNSFALQVGFRSQVLLVRLRQPDEELCAARLDEVRIMPTSCSVGSLTSTSG